MRVLLVEDDDLVRLCLAEGLDDAGWRVTAAASGEEALRQAHADGAPAVIVTALLLGRRVSGAELIAAVRRRWPPIAAVLISGANVSEPHLGPDDRFLRKPFHIGALVQVIEALTAKQALTDRPAHRWAGMGAR